MLAEVIWDQQSIAIVATFSVPIIGALAYYWHKTECRRSDNELKRSMVERGFTADEIERVIAASSDEKAASQKAAT